MNIEEALTVRPPERVYQHVEPYWLRVSNALAVLQAAVPRLQRDARRLDWLADPAQSIGNVELPRACVEQNLHSLRAAIDCAMDVAPRGPQAQPGPPVRP